MHKLGFPYGAKSTILSIPKKILESENESIITSFLRGLFDTDGCLHLLKRSERWAYSKFKKTHHYYPVIKFSTISEMLHKEVRDLLNRLKFGKLGNYTYNSKKTTEKNKIYGYLIW